ncbi:hypothetical protein ACWKWC_02790 [Geodermatophilus nigrescens]
MWNWQDGLQAWGAMTAVAVVLMAVITALAWYAHHHVTAEDDPDLTAELRG